MQEYLWINYRVERVSELCLLDESLSKYIELSKKDKAMGWMSLFSDNTKHVRIKRYS